MLSKVSNRVCAVSRNLSCPEKISERSVISDTDTDADADADADTDVDATCDWKKASPKRLAAKASAADSASTQVEFVSKNLLHRILTRAQSQVVIQLV